MIQAVSIYNDVSFYNKVYNELQTYCNISFNNKISNHIDYLYNYYILINHWGIPHFFALDVIKQAYEMDCKQYWMCKFDFILAFKFQPIMKPIYRYYNEYIDEAYTSIYSNSDEIILLSINDKFLDDKYINFHHQIIFNFKKNSWKILPKLYRYKTPYSK